MSPTVCQVPEHKNRRKGCCPCCGGCKICPMQSEGCVAHHIRAGNPERPAAIRKRKRRKSRGTPERDASRGTVLRKIQEAMRALGCEEDEMMREWPFSKKLPLEVLDQAASAVIRQMICLISGVTGEEAVGGDEREALLRVVGEFTVAKNTGVTIAESNALLANLTSLAVDANARTQRYMRSVICQSLSWKQSREILVEASAHISGSAVLGNFAYRSRRADYMDLQAGNDLEAALSYVQLKREDVVNALEFIQSNCDLSWRTGHTVSRTIRSLKVELPRLKRHLTMEYMFGEYARWGAEQTVATIGRTEFNSLLRLITVEVREVTGASYYYTDGIIDSFKMINELLERLKQITQPSVACEIERLAARATLMQYFLKYELKAHLVTSVEGCAEGFHCVKHAVNGGAVIEMVHAVGLV